MSSSSEPESKEKAQDGKIEELQKKKIQKYLEKLIKKVDSYARDKTQANEERKTKGQKKGRLTEREEDEMIMQESQKDLDENQTDLRLSKQPSIVTGQMRTYQLDALNWMIRLYNQGVSGILADEMGLGKTLQSISMLAYLRQFRGIPGPHLVVAPLSTLGNWCREFQQWCPSIKVLKFHGNKEERAKMISKDLKPGKFDVCLTSYEIAIKNKSVLAKFPWEFLIVDEAHRLKNEKSLLSQMLRIFKSKHRLLLTGTPLQNNLHELWALLNFLLPDIFASSQEFDELFNVESTNQASSSVIETLHQILRPFMMRRLKKDVEKDLPPKKETIIFVGMSGVQKKVYKDVLTRDLDAISGGRAEKTRLLNIVMQLRKAANHPYLFDGIEDRTEDVFGEHIINNSGKMVVLDKLLTRLQAKGSRVLIFSQMTRTLDILEDYCIYRGHRYCRIDGSTGTVGREEAMKEFNRPNSDKFLFLLSTRAGGLGINLHTADIVIIYDSDWNPQMDLQAQDRAHRIGQKKPVFVYRFITENTIEVKILERAEIKLRLDALVIQSGVKSQPKNALSKDDLLEAIRFGADMAFKSQDSTISDEDIEVILGNAEQKTAEMTSKLQKHVGLMDLSLKGDQPIPMSIEDYKDKPLIPEELAKLRKEMQDEQIRKIHESMPKRERKQLNAYNTDEYYRQAMKAKKGKSGLIKPRKLPKMADYQFFDQKRLEDLLQKETNYWLKYKNDPNPPRPSGLTPEEEAEREQLLKEGFSTWKRADFYNFVSACERYGKSNVDKICKSIEGKSEGEVRNYHVVFFQKLNTLPKSKSIQTRIERGEKKLYRTVEMETLLKQCFEAGDYKERRRALEEFPLKLTSAQKGKGYSETNDRFLLYEMWRLGYGEADKLKDSIRAEPLFRFDYFFKSRSSAELMRRVDTLLTLKKRDFGGDKKKRERKPKEGGKARGKKRKEMDDKDEGTAKIAKKQKAEPEKQSAKKRKKASKDEGEGDATQNKNSDSED